MCQVTCSKCKAGFYGDLCESEGTPTSASQCDPAAVIVFEKSSGSLVSCSTCDPGFKGTACDTACEDGKYGAGCTHSCAAPSGCDGKVPPPDSFGPPRDCCWQTCYVLKSSIRVSS